MLMVSFGEQLNNLQSVKNDLTTRQRAYQSYDAHLLDISGDYSGSPLERYLAEEDIETCQEFLGYMATRNYPNTQEISMKYPRIGDYAWKKPNQFENFAFTHGNSREVWKGKGYYIGQVAVAYGECKLVLSPRNEDTVQSSGELRCDRSPRSFKRSYGLGYGKLPDLPSEKIPLELPGLDKYLLGYVHPL